MESMETTYASIEAGGERPDNYISGLIQLAEENLYFSDDNDLGGALFVDGRGWTMAALLTSSSGVNYKLPIGVNNAGNYERFLKGLTTMGDVFRIPELFYVRFRCLVCGTAGFLPATWKVYINMQSRNL